MPNLSGTIATWERSCPLDGVCPECGSTELTEPREFNLMMKTYVGPVFDDDHTAVDYRQDVSFPYLYRAIA